MNCVKNAACLHGSLIACIAALLLKEAGLAEPFLGRIESGISKKKKKKKNCMAGGTSRKQCAWIARGLEQTRARLRCHTGLACARSCMQMQ